MENQAAVADIVTGATGSSTGFIQAVERALIKASPDKPTDKKYFDGVFMGRSDVASRGYYKVVWITIKDDKIVDFKAQRALPTAASRIRPSMVGPWRWLGKLTKKQPSSPNPVSLTPSAEPPV